MKFACLEFETFKVIMDVTMEKDKKSNFKY
jgi:hypothetical protein